MNNALADQYRVMVANTLGVTPEQVLNTMLDSGIDFLIEFLGEENADEVQRFAAIPEYWTWFRQLWANADVKFITAMNNKPKLLRMIKSHRVELNTYAKFHWYEMNGKRPNSFVMVEFTKAMKSEGKLVKG